MFESKINRGKANGYASLDSNGKLPLSNLPPIDMEGYATTGSNVFLDDQIISGSLNVSGSITVNGSASLPHLELTNESFIFNPYDGELITFTKEDYGNQVDNIGINVRITRGNNQGIYNISLESSWSQNGDGQDSPEGTLWNSDGWNTLRGVTQRTYTTFYNAVGGNIGQNVVGLELIMFDTINEKYYAIKFLSWTQNGNGGGFSYTRQLLNTSDLFVKLDNAVNIIDVFIEDNGQGSGIGITRGNNQGIYNPYREEGWDGDVSPVGTLWNIEGWSDLSNIQTRSYKTFYSAFGNGGLGNKVIGTECIMYIPESEKYYAIKFTDWTQNNNGGGFAYLRYEIDVTKLNEGIKFADGSILKSAQGVGKVKAKFGGRRIEEHVGYSEALFINATYSPSVEAIVYNDNNGNFDFSIVDTPELIELNNNRDSYTRIEFSFDGQSTWREVVLSGGATGVWRQFYFPVNNPQNYVTVTSGQTLYYRVVTGAQPVRWFNAEGSDFRGAIIDFHAFSRSSGTIIGTIHIANDDGDDNITHTETSSGGSDLENVDMWYRNPNGNEREIWFRRLDNSEDTLKIQWIAKMFYGSETYD